MASTPGIAIRMMKQALAATFTGFQRLFAAVGLRSWKAGQTRHEEPSFSSTAQTVIPDTIHIYIDEGWPGDQNETMKDVGVIAGVVWLGAAPEYGTLPHVRTHLHSSGDRALSRMLLCDRVLPFVFRFQPMPKRRRRSEQYFRMLKDSVFLLLGWVLPRPAVGSNVFIHAERHPPFCGGEDKTPHFRKLVARAAKTPSAWRFSGWSIKKVEWHGKSFEYIPYADLVGYLMAETPDANRMAAKFRVSQWPGFAVVSPGLIQSLMDLDAESSAGVSWHRSARAILSARSTKSTKRRQACGRRTR